VSRRPLASAALSVDDSLPYEDARRKAVGAFERRYGVVAK